VSDQGGGGSVWGRFLEVCFLRGVLVGGCVKGIDGLVGGGERNVLSGLLLPPNLCAPLPPYCVELWALHFLDLFNWAFSRKSQGG